MKHTNWIAVLALLVSACFGGAEFGSVPAQRYQVSPTDQSDASTQTDPLLDAGSVDGAAGGASGGATSGSSGSTSMSGGHAGAVQGNAGEGNAGEGSTDLDAGSLPLDASLVDGSQVDAADCVATLVNRDGWIATAFSSTTFTPANAIDSQIGTRWQSGVAQGSQSPEWFQIDFGAALHVRSVTLYSNIVADQPAALSLTVTDTPNDLAAAALEQVIPGAVTSFTVQLDAVGRYLLLQQTGTSAAWWSINDLTVEACSQ